MERIIIEVGFQQDGLTFRLSPTTRKYLRETVGAEPGATSLFVGLDRRAGSDVSRPGPMWLQAASLLTGLSEIRLTELGGVRFVDPVDERVLHETEGEERRVQPS